MTRWVSSAPICSIGCRRCGFTCRRCAIACKIRSKPRLVRSDLLGIHGGHVRDCGDTPLLRE
jgi:hypothetical protein